MPAPIAPQLFTRVMSLPDETREDLLEFLGGSAVDDDSLEKLIDSLACKKDTPKPQPLAAR